MRKAETVLSWVLRVVAAGILLQTLFFKFTGSEESIYIFQTLGVEPWGRIASGVVELVASVLLLWPGRTVYGAGLATMVMAGAIGSHLMRLGIVVMDDGGLLFGMACVVFASSVALLWLHRADLRARLLDNSN